MIGPEDQHPWDQEDEEIRKAFSEKDASIAILKSLLTEAALQYEDQAREIERLREENAHFAWRNKDKNKLITELADALEACGTKPHIELMQRAREAKKHE